MTYNDGAHALHSEGDSGRQLRVLSHLEITDETTRLFDGVISVKREIHVGLGAAWKDRRSEDLKLE